MTEHDREVFAWWWYFTQFKAAKEQGRLTAMEQHADTLYRLAKSLAHAAPKELKQV